MTRQLYVDNCDRRMAGNLSSIYQTLISLFNLSQDKFFYNDEIVNVFLEKMHATIGAKVKKHVENVRKQILGSNPVPRLILEHILADKFSKSINEQIRESARTLTTPTVNHLVSYNYNYTLQIFTDLQEIFEEMHGINTFGF